MGANSCTRRLQRPSRISGVLTSKVKPEGGCSRQAHLRVAQVLHQFALDICSFSYQDPTARIRQPVDRRKRWGHSYQLKWR